MASVSNNRVSSNSMSKDEEDHHYRASSIHTMTRHQGPWIDICLALGSHVLDQSVYIYHAWIWLRIMWCFINKVIKGLWELCI